MGTFSKYTKEGPGVTKEQANAPALIQFFRILGTRFWSMIALNLIYLVFCLPIITFGPATAGMTKVLRNWSRREGAFLWGDFWETFKNNFKHGLIVGLVQLLVSAVLIFDGLFFYICMANTGLKTIAIAVIALSLLVWTYMHYYIYTMLITFRLSLKQLYKNAFIFAGAGFFRNTLITLILAALIWIFWIFAVNPIVWIFYIIFFGAFSGYVIVFITYPLIKRYMIDNVDPKTGERIPTEDQ